MFEHPEPRTLPRRGPGRGVPDDACACVDELIEPFLDGELTPANRFLVDDHVARCARCATQLSLAHRVQDTLHELPAQAFPPALVPSETARHKPGWRRWLADRSFFGWLGAGRGGTMPAWVTTAAAAALAAVLATGLFLRPAPPPPGQEPLPGQNIMQAEADVKLALAYLGRIGARTGNIVVQDVLEARVALPIVRSVRDVLRPPTADAKNPSR